jgi:hypothetical protein
MNYVFDSITDDKIEKEKLNKEVKLMIKKLNKVEQKYIEDSVDSTLIFLKVKDYNLSIKEMRYLLHNIQKSHYIINRKKDVFNRVKFYHKVNRILSRSDSEKLCNFTIDNDESDKKLIGKGAGGIAYKVTHSKFDKPIVAKVMDADSDENIDEIQYYKRLKNLVLDFKTPHLPLTWDDLNCGDKCVFIDTEEVSSDRLEKLKWDSIKNGKCFLLFSEFFNGDLSKFNKINTKEMLYSIIFQVICGLYILDKENLYHGDLNLGNVLYLNIKDIPNIPNKKYIKYKYDNKTFYINHMDFLWVLWDFEYMNKKGNRIHENFTPEYLTGFFAEEVIDEIENKWGRYDDPKSNFVSGTWMFDLIDLIVGLRFMVRKNKELVKIIDIIYKNVLELFLNKDLTLTPINAIPTIFKDLKDSDISNIFIEDERKDLEDETLAYFEY